MKKPTSSLPPSGKKQSEKVSHKTTVLSVLSALESLTLAFLLAFVFKGFVVEAFAIPTGSMAETLLGAHTETICQRCRYTYSSSVPTEQKGRYRRRLVNSSRMRCPNCGDTTLTGGRSRSGDRVLVLKPMYFLSRYKGLEWLAPKRWDVAVFLYPGTGQDNYIKRITGLPGESIEVVDGDIYIDGQIERKPQRVQEEMWITLFDNDYQRQNDGPDRPVWQGESGKIERLQNGRVLRLKATSGEEALVHYKDVIHNGLAYNALHGQPWPGSASVRDLRLSFDVIGRELSDASEVTAVLTEENRQFRLRLSLSPKEPIIELQSRYPGQTAWQTWRDEQGSALRRQHKAMALGESIRLRLQNVDQRVSIWVDSEELLASNSTTRDAGNWPQNELRTYVAITDNNCELDLLHIKLERDAYYTTSTIREGYFQRACGKPFPIPPNPENPNQAYFAMGDNSSNSEDSRRWTLKHPGLDDRYVRGTVPRSHMIGQAFFVYWPSGGTILGQRLPLIPRVGQMRPIR